MDLSRIFEYKELLKTSKSFQKINLIFVMDFIEI